MQTIERWFDDFEIGAMRQSVGRTITEADIVLHAGQTGDFFPHHMDAEWMATQPAGERIAHGTLILSVAVGMTAGDINPQAMSYGDDRIRFIKPVFINDTMTVTAQITDKSDHKKAPSALRIRSRAGCGHQPTPGDGASAHAPLSGEPPHRARKSMTSPRAWRDTAEKHDLD